ncbi:MAG: hypothetical protein ACR2OO_08965 [Thermomicrobiales bacterium]
MPAMTIRQELQRLADELDDKQIRSTLDYVRRIIGVADNDGRDASAAPDASADHPPKPLWGIAGIGRSGERSSVKEHDDEYLADAFVPRRR